ncbi:MAG: uL4 family ribosomal protein [Desulfomicrobium escambiense]|nr:uL4 family ribosomal protein [Desulfomicrobium escambiense]
MFGVPVKPHLLHEVGDHASWPTGAAAPPRPRTAARSPAAARKPWQAEGHRPGARGGINRSPAAGGTAASSSGRTPRDLHASSCPKKVRQLALRSALSSKCQRERADGGRRARPRPSSRPRRFVERCGALGARRSTLLVVDGGDEPQPGAGLAQPARASRCCARERPERLRRAQVRHARAAAAGGHRAHRGGLIAMKTYADHHAAPDHREDARCSEGDASNKVILRGRPPRPTRSRSSRPWRSCSSVQVVDVQHHEHARARRKRCGPASRQAPATGRRRS